LSRKVNHVLVTVNVTYLTLLIYTVVNLKDVVVSIEKYGVMNHKGFALEILHHMRVRQIA